MDKHTVLSGYLPMSCSCSLPWSRKDDIALSGLAEVCFWNTPGLADATDDRIVELPFVVLMEVPAQGVFQATGIQLQTKISSV